MAKNEVTRIYQGRITSVSSLCGEPCKLSPEEADQLLWSHHVLYQDAVNYYLFCLASMASSENTFIGKLWMRMRDVWNDFKRHGELRQGLKHSLVRTLGHAEKLMDEKYGMDAAKDIVLMGNVASADTLEKAIEQIADKCIIHGDIKQQGGTYIARICDPDYGGNWECDEKAIKAAAGMGKLAKALYSNDAVAQMKVLAVDMEIDWCGIKTQTDQYFEDADARAELRKAIQFFLDRNDKIGRNVKELLNTDTEHVDNILRGYLEKVESLGNIRYGRNNKTDVSKRNMAWILKFFPDELTVNIARAFIKAPQDNISSMSMNCTDPVKEARGNRGYVFPFFTSFKFRVIDANTKKFDKEAFVEALKTINQFNKKTNERTRELEIFHKAFDWMNGKSSLSKPPRLDDEASDEDDDRTPLPILNGDSRWEHLKDILADDLRVDNPFTGNTLVEYGLTSRTIRCADMIFREWEKVYKEVRSGTLLEDEAVREMIEYLKKIQSNNPEVFGSAALFRELAQKDNWCIWLTDWREPGTYRSTNILEDAVCYSYIAEQLERLDSPINFTPADPQYSRRQCDLKPFTNRKMGHIGSGRYAVYLTEESDGKCTFMPFELDYSAPRLCRDKLQSADGSIYFPPAVQALMEMEQADSVDFTSVDVQLMPDIDRKGNKRYLLNFLPKLETTGILSQTASDFRHGQLYFTQETNTCLLWPSYGLSDKLNWYKDGKPFDIIAVDLGQRTAGALSRITVSTELSKNSVMIGHDGVHEWFACCIYAGLLRLPGEGGTILNGTSREPEPYGKHGRCATCEETEQATRIAAMLSPDGNSDIMLDGNAVVRFFPEQNDRLLIALRQATGKLRQLARFHYGIASHEVTDKLKNELDNCPWLSGDKSLAEIMRLEDKYRTLLPEILLELANRILPLRGRKWCWDINPDTGSRRLKQTGIGTADPHKWIRGQRGLTFQRIEQLEELRMRCQAVNRILMDKPGAKPKSVKEMRETSIPDPCPDILMRLEEMKEQRVNQTANMILMQALGLRHRQHVTDAKTRNETGVHGEYEKIPGLKPAAFIAIENLSRYGFSQDRSRHENSRLMKWAHRAIRQKLILLCEIYGIPVVEVNAAYSSKFSAKGIPGFRAEEVSPDAIRKSFTWGKILEKTNSEEAKAVYNCLLVADELQKISPKATVLMPKNGGPVFVCFCQDDRTVQADINASYNIGLRAITEGTQLFVNNRLSMERTGSASNLWHIKRSSKLSKSLYKSNYEIGYMPCSETKSGKGGNFFVLGCSSSELLYNGEQKPIFSSPELRYKFPNLMFGSGIWRNMLRQLRRCLELNRKRLEIARIRNDEAQRV